VMRRQTGGRVLLLVTGALAVAAVTACGSGEPASSSSPGSAPVSVPSTGQSKPEKATAVGQTGANASRNGGPCRTADLTAALGAKKEVPVNVQGQLGAAGTHYSVDLVWTNRSGHPCTMQGFGGVDVLGPDQAPDRPAFPLPRTGDTPAAVQVAAGGTAHTTITYIDPSGVRPDSQSAALWTPTGLSVTPPNETTHLSVPWTLGTPFDQDAESGALAAAISPVSAGS